MTGNASPSRPRRPEGRRLGGIGRVTVGAAAVVVLVVGGAGPAGAAPQTTMAIEPTGDISTPPTVTGSFRGSTLLLDVEKIVAIDLAVSPTGPTGGSAVTQDGCEVVSAGACDSPQVSYSWDVSELAYNGPYLVEASAKWCDPLLCLSQATASATPIEFRLAAEPTAPTDVRADARADRSVVVSWARNGEPDLKHYGLFRKDPGGEFRRIGGDIEQPDSGRPTFTDATVATTGGGDFVYRVFAVRNGPSGDESTDKISRGSSDRTITVVAPPPSTVAPGGDPAGPPVTTAGEGVDISSFLSGQAPTLDAPSPIFLDLPDTGFGESLPFGILPDEAEPGEEDAVLPESPRQRQIAEFKRNRPLIPVAAGAILLVLAGHIRLLNVRTKQPAQPKKLPPGTYVARALEAARANSVRIEPVPIEPVPIAVATAAAHGRRHRVPPSGVDVAKLPVWAEFEPASGRGLVETSGADSGADSDASADDVDGAAHDRRQFALFAPHGPYDAESESDVDEVADEAEQFQAEAEDDEADELEADELEAEAEEFESDELEAEAEADDSEAEAETDVVEADELEADELEADELEADELEAEVVEAEVVEADELELDELEGDELGANEVEADAEADEVEADEVEGDEVVDHELDQYMIDEWAKLEVEAQNEVALDEVGEVAEADEHEPDDIEVDGRRKADVAHTFAPRPLPKRPVVASAPGAAAERAAPSVVVSTPKGASKRTPWRMAEPAVASTPGVERERTAEPVASAPKPVSRRMAKRLAEPVVASTPSVEPERTAEPVASAQKPVSRRMARRMAEPVVASTAGVAPARVAEPVVASAPKADSRRMAKRVAASVPPALSKLRAERSDEPVVSSVPRTGPRHQDERAVASTPKPGPTPPSESQLVIAPPPPPQPTPEARQNRESLWEPELALEMRPELLYAFEPDPRWQADPQPDPDPDDEADIDPDLLYAFEHGSAWSPTPTPTPTPTPEPDADPEPAYAFDDESEWVAEVEVFVSPRR